MCSIGRKNWIVFISFVYYLLYLESLTNARPEQTRRNSTFTNLTFNVNEDVSSSDRIVTAVRILAKPKIRRGGIPQEYHKQSPNNQHIIFPDDSDGDESRIIPPIKPYERPSCAKGSTYCVKIDSYPSDLVERMLQVSTHLDDLFGIDDGPDEIANRWGDDTDISLCQSVDKTIFPKYGKTKSNKWKFIVNQDGSDKYVQGIRVETCTNPGGPCSLLSNETLGYTSYCKQKYVYRRLISLSEEGQPTTDVFEVPSACCCSYKKIHLDGLSFK